MGSQRSRTNEVASGQPERGAVRSRSSLPAERSNSADEGAAGSPRAEVQWHLSPCPCGHIPHEGRCPAKRRVPNYVYGGFRWKRCLCEVSA